MLNLSDILAFFVISSLKFMIMVSWIISSTSFLCYYDFEVVNSAAIHEKGMYLRDLIFSASDGIVTTFAIVAGSEGASLPSSIVVILGFANLFADGISMASGSYLGIKSEAEYERTKHAGAFDHAPLKHAGVTFLSFAVAGFFPLIPYLCSCGNRFVNSTVLVAVSLFVIGSIRTRFTRKNIFVSGLEMLVVGGFAAAAAYGVGMLLNSTVL
jgi:VIT1/CCC1 family predicted Fe2+/Mn2+ transporter